MGNCAGSHHVVAPKQLTAVEPTTLPLYPFLGLGFSKDFYILEIKSSGLVRRSGTDIQVNDRIYSVGSCVVRNHEDFTNCLMDLAQECVSGIHLHIIRTSAQNELLFLDRFVPFHDFSSPSASSPPSSSSTSPFGPNMNLCPFHHGTKTARRSTAPDLSISEHKDDNDEKNPLCVLCMSAKSEYVCVPCGHVIYCVSCGTSAAKTNANNCPICRAAVEKCIKIYA